MGNERAILFATDPPYAVGYAGGSHPATRANRAKANRDRDWSKVYREAGRTTFDNEDGGGDGGRSFYLAFYEVAIERAIAPNAAWLPPPGRRCLRTFGTKSALSITNKLSGSRADPS
jgi:hypothetical protein